jgi:hypothetical protein
MAAKLKKPTGARKSKVAKKTKGVRSKGAGRTVRRQTSQRATAVKTPTSAVAAPEDDDTWSPVGNEVGIRVRMYRVGFGDFFLISCLQDKADPVHIIIDCGVFKGTSGTGDLGSISDAVDNMARVTDGNVALIMVTHRHADHIAGFARRSDAFTKLKVEAIWMSAWESQYPAVKEYQAQLTNTASALQTHFTGLAAASSDENTALGFMGNAVGEGGGNAKALQLLNGGIGGVTPQYYEAGHVPDLPASFTHAGISARILGPPPIADIQLMKLMDLQKGVGQYLAVASAGDLEARTPFAKIWDAPGNARAYPAECFDEWRAREWHGEKTLAISALAAAELMEKAMDAAQPDAALLAATQLNSFLNNQSLVVLFNIKGKNLLFVGDAQAGNWKHWTYDTDDPGKTTTGDMAAEAQKILTSLDFYKVGHHGSGNATPKAVVSMMGKGNQKFAAMCSTEKGVYGRENLDPSIGTEVPRLPLMTALAGVASVVRSDQLAIKTGMIDKPAQVTEPLPAAAGGSRFQKGTFWIDCFL